MISDSPTIGGRYPLWYHLPMFPYSLLMPKRRVFVSYHHESDQNFYWEFARLFGDAYQLVTDRSLERPVDSDDPTYAMRRIRESHLKGASCTIILCGMATFGRKYVDWEICASLNQDAALIGVHLPTFFPAPIPWRLHDNVLSGYAVMADWNSLVAAPLTLKLYLENALARSKALINNSRPTMRRNQ